MPSRPRIHRPKSNLARVAYQKPAQKDRFYGRKWKEVSRAFRLGKVCAECQKEGKVVPAEVVDHAIPHKWNYDLFWDENNWVPLCARHHNIKTARDDGGLGNRRKGK